MMRTDASAHWFDATVKAAVDDLVLLQWKAGSAFVNLPFSYATGSSVTVMISPASGGYRVSDNGFAYREIEGIGKEKSFAKLAPQIMQDSNLQKNTRVIFTDVPFSGLHSAISEVAIASWRVVDRVFSALGNAEEDEIAEYLLERLVKIFGAPNVSPSSLTGASTSRWELTAVVRLNGQVAAFQAVAIHANSIYRTNAAFDDLSSLDHPPHLIAVVKDKSAFGPRLSLLSRSGRVIEETQPDPVYRRAAA